MTVLTVVMGLALTVELIIISRLVRNPDVTVIGQQIEALEALIRDGHRLQDHHADSLIRRLRGVEESVARTEREGRIVSLQLAELTLASDGPTGGNNPVAESDARRLRPLANGATADGR